jgi:hypothetical protein
MSMFMGLSFSSNSRLYLSSSLSEADVIGYVYERDLRGGLFPLDLAIFSLQSSLFPVEHEHYYLCGESYRRLALVTCLRIETTNIGLLLLYGPSTTLRNKLHTQLERP